MSESMPIPSSNPIHHALGYMAAMRSAIRCGEEWSEQEFAELQKVMDALREEAEHVKNTRLLSHVQGLCEGFDIAAPEQLKESEQELAKAEAILATLRAENERLAERADFLARMNGEKQLLLDTIDALCEAIHGRLLTDEYQDKATTINAMAQMIDRLTQQLAETETACRVLTLAANELERVRRERDQLSEQLAAAETTIRNLEGLPPMTGMRTK